VTAVTSRFVPKLRLDLFRDPREVVRPLNRDLDPDDPLPPTGAARSTTAA